MGKHAFKNDFRKSFFSIKQTISFWYYCFGNLFFWKKKHFFFPKQLVSETVIYGGKNFEKLYIQYNKANKFTLYLFRLLINFILLVIFFYLTLSLSFILRLCVFSFFEITLIVEAADEMNLSFQ